MRRPAAELAAAIAAGRRRFGPPLALVAVLLGALGALRPRVGGEPVRPAGPDPGPRRAVGLPRRGGPSRRARRSSRPSSGSASRSSAPRPSRSRWTASRWARRAVEPLLVGSQTVPIVAIAPLIVVWFGFGLLPKVLVVVLVTFFPITIALLDGFASTSAEATELMRSFGASAGQTFRKIRWPSGLPALLHRASGSRRRTGSWPRSSGSTSAPPTASGSGCSSASARSGPTSCSRAILLTAVLSIGLYGLVVAAERAHDPVVAGIARGGSGGSRALEA